MFRREEEARIIAVTGLDHLLNVTLKSTEDTHTKQSVILDTLSLLRRGLCQQARVRVAVYTSNNSIHKNMLLQLCPL